MQQRSTARTVQCERCNGHFPLTELLPAVHCPFCGHHQTLSSTTFHEVREYEARVRANMDQASEAAMHAAAWERWHARPGGMRSIYLLSWLPVLVVVIVMSLGVAGHLLWPLVMLACVPIYIVAYRARAHTGHARVSAGGHEVACPNCGAPNVLEVGQAADTCQYCQAGLLPSHTVMMRGLDAARAMQRHTAMERHRHERNGRAHMLQYQKYPNMLKYLYIGFLVVAALGGALYTALQELVRTGELTPAVAGGLGMGVAVILVLVLVLRWRSRRIRLWNQTLADLAWQFRGQVLAGKQASIGWLNRYWAGPYDWSYFSWSPMAACAAIDACGYPGLIDIDPARSTEHRIARVNILVAAWVPGLSDGVDLQLGREATAIQAELAGQGFACDIGEAGIVAAATEARVNEIRKHPSAAHALAPIIVKVAHLAAAVGAEPVQAL